MFAFLQSRLGLDEFHQVLSKRSGRWYNACLRITRDAQLAEDAVQDALLKAWGQRDKFRGAADLDTWIHRIALNAAIDLLRRRHPVADEEADPDLHAAPAQNSPEQHFTRQALNGDLSLAMQRWQASLERAARVDNGADSNILAPALSGASFSWRAGLAAFGVVLLAAGISLSMFTPRTTPDLAPDGDPKVSATALATNDPANGASRYERCLQWHLAQTEQLLAGLGAASREEQAALLDKAMMQNRLYAIAADRSREDRLARVLRPFNPLLENLLDVRGAKYAFEASIR